MGEIKNRNVCHAVLILLALLALFNLVSASTLPIDVNLYLYSEETGSHVLIDSNNVDTQIFKTKGIKLVYIPVDFNNNFDEEAEKYSAFTEAIYPVANDNFAYEIKNDTYISCKEQFNPLRFMECLSPSYVYYSLSNQYALANPLGALFSPSYIVGVIPRAWFARYGFDDNVVGGALSVSWALPGNPVLVETHQGRNPVAHEIGHLYGFSDEYEGGTCHDNSPNPCTSHIVTGFWVENKKQENREITEDDGFNCFMDSASDNRWIGTEEYLHLLDNFKVNQSSENYQKNSLYGSSRTLIVSGMADKNGSVILGNAYLINEEISQDITPGDYSIKLLDSNGRALSDINFSASFALLSDPPIDFNQTAFGLVIPFVEDAHKIQIDVNGETKAERTISANPPMVSVVSPAGGETWSGTHEIVWDGQDADNDTLSYVLQYSADDGNSWNPLAIDVNTESYEWDVGWAEPGGNYRVKVIATDGVLTGEGISGKFTIRNPDIDLAPAKWEFGSAAQGETISRDFNILNTGNADLNVAEITFSEGISISGISLPAAIAPGARKSFGATLETANLSGEIENEIVVSSNDPNEGTKRIRVLGEVKAPVPDVNITLTLPSEVKIDGNFSIEALVEVRGVELKDANVVLVLPAGLYSPYELTVPLGDVPAGEGRSVEWELNAEHAGLFEPTVVVYSANAPAKAESAAVSVEHIWIEGGPDHKTYGEDENVTITAYAMNYSVDVGYMDFNLNVAVTTPSGMNNFSVRRHIGMLQATETNEMKIEWNRTGKELGTYSVEGTLRSSSGTVLDSFTTSFEVIPPMPPVLAPIGPQAAREYELFELKVTASDPNRDALVFSDDTEHFDINQDTGLISFTPQQEDVGAWDVNICVTDGRFFDCELVTFTVENVNDAPVLDYIGPQTAVEGELFSLDLNAYDHDGDELAYSVAVDANPQNSINFGKLEAGGLFGEFYDNIAGASPNVEIDYNSFVGVKFHGAINLEKEGDFNVAGLTASDYFAVVWEGFIKIPQDADDYIFYIASDDGSRLYVDGNKIIDYWSNHAEKEAASIPLQLAGGFHLIKLEFYDGKCIWSNGGSRMRLRWSSQSAGIAKQIIPADYLYDSYHLLNFSPAAGNVSFTPEKEDAGAWYALASVTDGNLVDSETFSLQVLVNSPMVEVLSPNGGEMVGGIYPIQFYVQDPDSGGVMKANMWASSAKGARETLIADSFDLFGEGRCVSPAFEHAFDKLCTFEFDSTNLKDGTYFLDVEVFDGKNRSADSSEGSFVVDNTKPVIELISPPAGSSIETGTPIVLDISDTYLEIAAWSRDSDDTNTLLACGDAGRRYWQKITIPKNNITGTLTDFPLLVYINDSSNPIFSRAKANGYDIAFVDDDGSTQLSHEIEYYSAEPGSEELIAWVKIPHLTDAADKTIYMYYGNPEASDQQDVNNVWDDNYVMVHHLQEKNGTHEDSTSNDNDGTPSGVTQNATGKIGRADEFDGDNDIINAGTSNSLNLYDDFTMSCWIYIDDFGSRNAIFSRPSSYWVRATGAYAGMWGIEKGGGNWYAINVDEKHILSSGQWYYLTVVHYANDTTVLYENGVDANGTNNVDGSTTLDIPSDTSATFYIGTWAGSSHDFDGLIDEVRISNTARNADWVSTSYNNQNDPVNFISLSAEEERSELCTIYTLDWQEKNVLLNVWANDFAGNLSHGAYSFNFYNVNNPPIIDSFLPEERSLVVGKGTSVGFGVSAHDPDGDELSYAWAVDDNAHSITYSDTNRFLMDTNQFGAGAHYVEVRVSDSNLSAYLGWEVEITHYNSPPVIDSYSPEGDSIVANRGEVLNFSVSAHDPDNDSLFVFWRLDTNLEEGVSAMEGGGTANQAVMPLNMPAAAALLPQEGGAANEALPGAGFSPQAVQSAVNPTPVLMEGGMDSNYSLDTADRSLGKYVLRVEVWDGNMGARHFWNIEITNGAPAINSFVPAQEELFAERGEKIEFGISATDPNNDGLYYLWMVDGNVTVEESPDANSFSLDTAPMELGLHYVKGCVADMINAVCRRWVVHIIYENRPPVVDSFSPEDVNLSVEKGRQLVFEIYAHDPDEDMLSYSWRLGSGQPSALAGEKPSAPAEPRAVQPSAMAPEPAQPGLAEPAQEQPSGRSFYRMDTSKTKAGNYSLAVDVNDGRHSVSHSWGVEVYETNSPPVIYYSEPKQKEISVEKGAKLRFSIYAYDPEGKKLSYLWIAKDSAGKTLVEIKDTNSLPVDTADVPEGKYILTVEVSDGKNSASQDWNIEVQGQKNRAPIITETIPAEGGVSAERGTKQRFVVSAYDPDHDALTYEWDVERKGTIIDYLGGLLNAAVGAFVSVFGGSTQPGRDEGAVIDPNSGWGSKPYIDFDTNKHTAGEYAITATVSDGNLSDSVSWTLTITPAASKSAPEKVGGTGPEPLPVTGRVVEVEPERVQQVEPARVQVVEPQRAQNVVPQRVEPRTVKPQRVQRIEPQPVQRVEPQRVQNTQPQRVQNVEPSRVQQVEPQRVQNVEPTNVQNTQPQIVQPTVVQTVQQVEPQNAQPAPQQVQPQQTVQQVQPAQQPVQAVQQLPPAQVVQPLPVVQADVNAQPLPVQRVN